CGSSPTRALWSRSEREGWAESIFGAADSAPGERSGRERRGRPSRFFCARRLRDAQQLPRARARASGRSARASGGVRSPVRSSGHRGELERVAAEGIAPQKGEPNCRPTTPTANNRRAINIAVSDLPERHGGNSLFRAKSW